MENKPAAPINKWQLMLSNISNQITAEIQVKLELGLPLK